MEARSPWAHILKFLKEKNSQPNIIYLAKLYFKIEGEIKTFPDKQNPMEFVTTRPVLQEMLEGVLHSEMKKHYRGRV